MSNDLTTLDLGGSANLANLGKAISTVKKSNDKPFLICRDGEWSFGVEQAEVCGTDLWVPRVQTFETGFIEWLNAKAGNEIMGRAGQEPDVNDLQCQFDEDDKDHRIVPQLAMEFVSVSGSNFGTVVLFKSSTVGGVNELRKLVETIIQYQTNNPQTEAIPVFSCSSSSYHNKRYGRKVFNPVFDIQYWDSPDLQITQGKSAAVNTPKQVQAEEKVEEKVIEGEVVEEVAESPKPTPGPAPKRRRKVS